MWFSVSKKQDIYKNYADPFLDEFEHRKTFWANRRNQWSRAKTLDKRYAKHRMRQNQKDEIQQELEDMDNDDWRILSVG